MSLRWLGMQGKETSQNAAAAWLMDNKSGYGEPILNRATTNGDLSRFRVIITAEEISTGEYVNFFFLVTLCKKGEVSNITNTRKRVL